jgi:hypothetical protein
MKVQPPGLARSEDILGAVARAVADLGVAGEQRAVKLIYLIVVTRLLDRIVSLAVKGPSSAGKSYLFTRVRPGVVWPPGQTTKPAQYPVFATIA